MNFHEESNLAEAGAEGIYVFLTQFGVGQAFSGGDAKTKSSARFAFFTAKSLRENYSARKTEVSGSSVASARFDELQKRRRGTQGSNVNTFFLRRNCRTIKKDGAICRQHAAESTVQKLS